MHIIVVRVVILNNELFSPVCSNLNLVIIPSSLSFCTLLNQILLRCRPCCTQYFDTLEGTKAFVALMKQIKINVES